MRSNNLRCPKLATSTPLFTLSKLSTPTTPSLTSCTSHLSLALPMCSYDLRCPTLTTTSPADPGRMVSSIRLSTLPAQCTCREEVNSIVSKILSRSVCQLQLEQQVQHPACGGEHVAKPREAP